MFNQFLGSPLSIVATLGNVALLGMIGYHVVNRGSITHWGRSLAAFGVGGLAVCFAAVFRDSYIDSIVATSDLSRNPGLFPADGLVSSLSTAGGAVALLSLLTGVFLRKPSQQRNLFFIASAAVVAKILIVEISRGTL